jgi:ATP-dependent DNA ligase
MSYLPKRENVMLCYPAEVKRLKKLGEKCFVQPKLRGNRCRIEWFQNEAVLISSYGNIIEFAGGLQEEMKELPKRPWDGELYKHGWSQERINGVASRTKNYNKDIEEIELHIFDVQDLEKQQWQRVQELYELQDQVRRTERIKVVPTSVMNTAEWQDAALLFLENGYEGAIFRSLTNLYRLGNPALRSAEVLKFKPKEQDEYRIVDIEQLVDKDGFTREELGSLIVVASEGETFAVGTGYTPQKRKELWNRRYDLIGRTAVVKHETLRTERGLPVCAVFVEVL